MVNAKQRGQVTVAVAVLVTGAGLLVAANVARAGMAGRGCQTAGGPEAVCLAVSGSPTAGGPLAPCPNPASATAESRSVEAAPSSSAVFLCGARYDVTSVPDAIDSKSVASYLSVPGNHYAVFVKGDAAGPQPAQVAGAGSFYCAPPKGARLVPGVVADTNGDQYPAWMANGETIGAPVYVEG